MQILEKQDCRVIHAALSDYKQELQKKKDGTDYALLIKRIDVLKETFFKQF